MTTIPIVRFDHHIEFQFTTPSSRQFSTKLKETELNLFKPQRLEPTRTASLMCNSFDRPTARVAPALHSKQPQPIQKDQLKITPRTRSEVAYSSLAKSINDQSDL